MSLENITFNGKPLGPLVNKPKQFRQGAKTARGKTIYRAGQKETHVIIAGIVFPWEQKAPYVPSGKSILGGLEYNMETDTIKCHECGDWSPMLGNHVRKHKKSAAEYRAEHGIAKRRSLNNLENQRKWSKLMKANPVAGSNRFKPAHKSVGGGTSVSIAAKERAARGMGFRRSPELANLQSKCRAQLSKRIMALAADLQRTPTARELIASGIPFGGVQKIFMMKYRDILIDLGLKPRRQWEKSRESV